MEVLLQQNSEHREGKGGGWTVFCSGPQFVLLLIEETKKGPHHYTRFLNEIRTGYDSNASLTHVKARSILKLTAGSTPCKPSVTSLRETKQTGTVTVLVGGTF